jgi:hypothetical protein
MAQQTQKDAAKETKERSGTSGQARATLGNPGNKKEIQTNRALQRDEKTGYPDSCTSAQPSGPHPSRVVEIKKKGIG